MFKLPEFPSIDLSKLDADALRKTELAKRLREIDSDKLIAVVRDAAYMTVGLGVVAVEQAEARRVQARDFTKAAGRQVRGFIRSAA